ncbi:MAG TPA: hypothetical protein VKH61_17410, partial [Streptosporangiaceae bacterium]|nr:hypothetical protein [Streptosporangiaceae bacterium]
GQDRPQMPLADDQHPVGDFGPDGEHESFRMGVREEPQVTIRILTGNRAVSSGRVQPSSGAMLPGRRVSCGNTLSDCAIHAGDG